MKIQPPADDDGLQQLKAADRAKGRVQATDHVEKSARIAPSEEQRENRPLVPVPRRGERRRGERRLKQEPVLLDTRSPHARRNKQRRATDQRADAEGSVEATQRQPVNGLDELV